MACEFDKGNYYDALTISIMLVVITVGGGGMIAKTDLIFDWLFLRPSPPRERWNMSM